MQKEAQQSLCARSEVSQSCTDVRATLLNAAVALGDNFLCVALSCLSLMFPTIASQTNRASTKQYISSMRRCPLFIGCRRRREEGLQEAVGGGQGEQEEVVGGGQENTGLPLLPLRQRSASCSHLPVRALL